jgi:ABC-2 type transport system ATP-binding protein
MNDRVIYMNDTPSVVPPAAAALPAVVARGLSKSFAARGATVDAVRGIDLTVHAAEIFSLLGPNGAGKTTTLRMLATLLPIGAGTVHIAGFDVARRPHDVRRRIGYVGQLGGADLPATGREQLYLQAKLYGLSAEQAARRIDELVELLALGEFVDRIARTYSGGQRRRLEIALGIVHRPDVLFLDEPTSGLDPQNRANLRDHVRTLRAAGTTVVLVTHYLEEADALADRVAIIDHGTVVAEGTPRELKQAIAGDALIVRPKVELADLERLRQRLAREPYVEQARAEGEALRLYVRDGALALPAVVDLLHAQGVPIGGISLNEASLDDVFLRQTGRSLRDAGPNHPEEVAA